MSNIWQRTVYNCGFRWEWAGMGYTSSTLVFGLKILSAHNCWASRKKKSAWQKNPKQIPQSFVFKVVVSWHSFELDLSDWYSRKGSQMGNSETHLLWLGLCVCACVNWHELWVTEGRLVPAAGNSDKIGTRGLLWWKMAYKILHFLIHLVGCKPYINSTWIIIDQWKFVLFLLRNMHSIWWK